MEKLLGGQDSLLFMLLDFLILENIKPLSINSFSKSETDSIFLLEYELFLTKDEGVEDATSSRE